MPPKTRITGDIMIKGAFDLIRKGLLFFFDFFVENVLY